MVPGAVRIVAGPKTRDMTGRKNCRQNNRGSDRSGTSISLVVARPSNESLKIADGSEFQKLKCEKHSENALKRKRTMPVDREKLEKAIVLLSAYQSTVDNVLYDHYSPTT